MRGLALIALLGLAACVSGGRDVGPSASDVEACSAESGFTARAQAAHAAGAMGEIPGTAQELAAINACLKAKAPASRPAASIPQPVKAKVTAPATATHGAPPPKAARPVASTARPTGASRRACHLEMVGGSGYACMPY